MIRCAMPALLLLQLVITGVALLPLATHAAPSATRRAADLATVERLDNAVAAVAFRLATSSTDLCPDHSYWTGLGLQDLNQYAPPWRAALVLRGQDSASYPWAQSVVTDGPAARAGLHAHDAILSINGDDLASVPTRKASYAGIDRTNRLLDAAAEAGPVTLRVGQGDATRTLIVRPVPGCRARVELTPGSGMNARADSGVAQIDGGLAAFARNDDELAVVIAHEMAHVILRHHDRLAGQKALRGGLFGQHGASALTRCTEDAADRLGMFLMERAGYDLAAAGTFWARYGVDVIKGRGGSSTHANWRARQQRAVQLAASLAAFRQAGRAPMLEPATLDCNI